MTDKRKTPLAGGAKSGTSTSGRADEQIIAQSHIQSNGNPNDDINDDIEALASEALDVSEPPPEQASERDEKKRETQAEILLRLARPVQFFKTPAGDLYATFPVNGHTETAPIVEKGGRFRRWLIKRFLEETARGPSTSAITDAIRTLEAEAEFGEVRDVFHRVAEHNGVLYIDMANANWEALKVTDEGWEIITDPPVRFVRTRGMLPLPTPESGGNIEELADFLNVKPDSREWMQVIGWLIGAYNPRGPYVHLSLYGEQGTAKSTAARVLRSLTDPNKVELRQPPKDIEDLAVIARHNRIVAIDNMSYLPGWLSDGLAVMATGGGMATRQLYTNDQEAVLEMLQPAILTAITEVVTRGDLLDRLAVVTLDPISEKDRREERIFWESFEKARPRIFGAILDALVLAIRDRYIVKLDRLPRMADHVVFVEAAAPALGWKRGQYAAVYTEAQSDAVAAQLEGNTMATVLMDWADNKAKAMPVTLKTGDLLKALDKHREALGIDKPKSWPGTATKLTGDLRRLAPGLRQAGYDLVYLKSRRKWKIEVR